MVPSDSTWGELRPCYSHRTPCWPMFRFFPHHNAAVQSEQVPVRRSSASLRAAPAAGLPGCLLQVSQSLLSLLRLGEKFCFRRIRLATNAALQSCIGQLGREMYASLLMSEPKLCLCPERAAFRLLFFCVTQARARGTQWFAHLSQSPGCTHN